MAFTSTLERNVFFSSAVAAVLIGPTRYRSGHDLCYTGQYNRIAPYLYPATMRARTYVVCT